MKRIVILSVAICFVVSAAAAALATDLSGAKNTVNRIRQPDPPSVSTTTKPSPVGQRATDYHPAGPSVHPVNVPSPVNKNNPRGDRDVQAGFDKNQREHGR
jgi:hypothetical protein